MGIGETAALELRDRVAIGVRQRIESDAAALSSPYSRILERVGARLFDPALRFRDVYRELGLKDTAMGALLGADLGMSLREYVLECRMEVAAEMLRAEPACTLREIAPAIGYLDVSAFAQAFRDFYGLTPGKLREWLLAESAELTPLELRYLRSSEWRDFFWGETFSPGLWKRLEALARGHDEERVLTLRQASFEQLEKEIAEDIGILLAGDPERLEGLSEVGFIFTTPALFERLSSLSRELGRRDRQLGVRLAEEALAVLGHLRGQLPGKDLAALEVRGWAWLGNAHRLAAEFGPAEEALQRAGALLKLADSKAAELEFFSTRIAFLRFRRRFAEALEVAEHALRVAADDLGDLRSIADIQLHRAITFREVGKLGQSIEILEELIERLDPQAHSLMLLTAWNTLALTYAQAQRPEAAGSAIEKAAEMAAFSAHPTARFHVEWVRGLIWVEAGQKDRALQTFETAREGFSGLENRGYVGLISLEQAAILIELGNTARAFQLAAEALATFEELAIDPAAIAALETLRQAVETRDLRARLLRRIGQDLRIHFG